VTSIFLFGAAKLYYDWRNRYVTLYSLPDLYANHTRQNAAKWQAMTPEQKETYLRENPVMTNKRYVTSLELEVDGR
jgi:hypothetical protein